MQTFAHILFPADFSARSEAMRPVLQAWARRFQAKVTILHTIQIPISSYGGPDGYPIVIDIPSIEATAKARLDRLELDAASVTRLVTVGDPAYEIAQYAAKNGVDLIMMATHGYGKFRGLLLGSTAAKVLHDAHCPVWTSAHDEAIPAASHAEVRTILCAIDLGPETADVVHSATELATAWNAKLQVVHAVATDETRKSREDAEALLKQSGFDLEVTVAAGATSHVIRDAAKACGADLVMTGHGKTHKTFGQLRSSTYEIIRDSPCPVLSA
jgi:nucleotide-binding universal stress UspA family protein